MCPSLRSFQPTRPTDLIQLECPLNSRVARDRRFQQHDYTLFHSVELAYVQRLRDVPDKSHLFSGSSSRLLCQAVTGSLKPLYVIKSSRRCNGDVRSEKDRYGPQ